MISFWVIVLLIVFTAFANYDHAVTGLQKFVTYTQIRLGAIGLFLWLVPFDFHHQFYGLATMASSALIGLVLAYQMFFRTRTSLREGVP